MGRSFARFLFGNAEQIVVLSDHCETNPGRIVFTQGTCNFMSDNFSQNPQCLRKSQMRHASNAEVCKALLLRRPFNFSFLRWQLQFTLSSQDINYPPEYLAESASKWPLLPFRENKDLRPLCETFFDKSKRERERQREREREREEGESEWVSTTFLTCPTHGIGMDFRTCLMAWCSKPACLRHQKPCLLGVFSFPGRLLADRFDTHAAQFLRRSRRAENRTFNRQYKPSDGGCCRVSWGIKLFHLQ